GGAAARGICAGLHAGLPVRTEFASPDGKRAGLCRAIGGPDVGRGGAVPRACWPHDVRRVGRFARLWVTGCVVGLRTRGTYRAQSSDTSMAVAVGANRDPRSGVRAKRVVF